jgi:hypothetical protein
MGDLPKEKEKSGLIAIGDLPKWKNDLIVMGDLPRKKNMENWSRCNGWPTQKNVGLIVMDDLSKEKKGKSGLIVMGDLPKWKNDLIVMGNLPR